jgi:hypothetical protein
VSIVQPPLYLIKYFNKILLIIFCQEASCVHHGIIMKSQGHYLNQACYKSGFISPDISFNVILTASSYPRTSPKTALIVASLASGYIGKIGFLPATYYGDIINPCFVLTIILKCARSK